jgi:hypothetical protein
VSTVYEGAVEVIADDALLQGDARLLLWDGWWGGFIRMKSVGGADLAHEAVKRHVTVDGSRAARVVARRAEEGSPMLWVWGVGAAPFSAADARRAGAARRRREERE